jgi:hypothetical protein
MVDSASEGVKRPRQQQGKEGDAQPAPLRLMAPSTLPQQAYHMDGPIGFRLVEFGLDSAHPSG